METTTAPEGLVGLLAQVHQALEAVLESAAALSDLSVEDLAGATQIAAGIARLSAATMARAVVAVEDQARLAEPEELLAARYGVRDAATFLATVTGASRRTLRIGVRPSGRSSRRRSARRHRVGPMVRSRMAMGPTARSLARPSRGGA